MAKSTFLRQSLSTTLFVIFLVLSLTSCVTPPKIASPDQLTAPSPRLDNKGTVMCPYTQDGVLAEWVDKAINAKMGATIGKHAGTYAGQKAMENVPFVGGFLGSMAGEAAGRAIAIEASGGMEYIISTSDMSFDNIDDMAVYLYVKHSSHEHYQAGLDATMEIYPELKKRYSQALHQAKTK